LADHEEFDVTPGYRNYVITLMLMVYIGNFVDRQIFSILIEPIRADIHLSDTQLGLLGGIAFAIFYAFAGIPIARWTDVGVRNPRLHPGANVLRTHLAMTQSLVTSAMRALASAILLFVLNLIGLGLGPVVAGALSDVLKPEYGEMSIRYSLFTLAVVGNFWSAIHYYLASRTLRTDLTARDALVASTSS